MNQWICALISVSVFFLQAGGQSAMAASLEIETWSDPGQVEGWTTAFDRVRLRQDHGALVWAANDGYDVEFIQADRNASEKAFVGNLQATTADEYSFDLTIDPGSDVQQLFVDLYNSEEREQWQTRLLPRHAGKKHTYHVPLNKSKGGWRQVSGTKSFETTLRNVTYVSVVIEEGRLGVGASGSLDNFRLSRGGDSAALLLYGTGIAMVIGLWLKRTLASGGG